MSPPPSWSRLPFPGLLISGQYIITCKFMPQQIASPPLRHVARLQWNTFGHQKHCLDTPFTPLISTKLLCSPQSVREQLNVEFHNSFTWRGRRRQLRHHLGWRWPNVNCCSGSLGISGAKEGSRKLSIRKVSPTRILAIYKSRATEPKK